MTTETSSDDKHEKDIVTRLMDATAPTPNTAWTTPSSAGGRPLDRRDNGGCCGATAVESGNRNDVDACDQHRCIVHWAGGSGG